MMNRDHHSVTLEGCEVRFPFVPYQPQEEYMKTIIDTLSCGNDHALLESPTGSGKTLSLLCSCLAFQEAFKKAICYDFISSRYPKYEVKRTHHYRPQFLEDRDLPMENDGDKLVNPMVLLQKNGEMKLLARENLKDVDNYVTQARTPQAERVLLNKICKFFDSFVGENKSWYPRIFYGTRTHSQIKQLVGELKKTTYEPKMIILGSRKRYCVNPRTSVEDNKDDACKELRRKKSCIYHRNAKDIKDFGDLLMMTKLDKVYDIEDLVDSGKKCQYCPYYVNYELVGKADIIFCPYNYLLDPRILDAMKGVKNGLKNGILILDEAHNIEDLCRTSVSSSYRAQSMKECVAEMRFLLRRRKIEEKVHEPLVEFLSDLRKKYLDEDLVEGEEIKEVKSVTYGVKKNDIRGFLKDYELDNKYVMEMYKFAMEAIRMANEKVEDKEEEEDGEEEGNMMVDEDGGGGKKKIKLNRLSAKSCLLLEDVFIPLHFICQNINHVDHFYVVVELTEAKQTRLPERVIHFFCMNPALAIKSLSETCYSIILTSGTLSPLTSFSSELGIKFKHSFESKHVVNVEKQVFIRSYNSYKKVKFNGSYKFIKSSMGPKYLNNLGEMITKLSNIIPYGILVFFPSYGFMNNCRSAWGGRDNTFRWRRKQKKRSGNRNTIISRMEENKTLFFESTASKGDKFKKDVEAYKKEIKDCEERNKGDMNARGGAIFFGVSRGKLSEGISFKDNESRGVVIISLPYPSLRDFGIALKKKWNTEAKQNVKKKSIYNRMLMDGSSWYNLQAMRAVNQALGRCIRHRLDYGAIFLLDQRFEQKRINFPQWIKHRVLSRHTFDQHEEAQLRNFFGNMAQMIRNEREVVRRSLSMRERGQERMDVSRNNRNMNGRHPQQQQQQQYHHPQQQQQQQHYNQPRKRMNHTTYSMMRHQQQRSNPSPPLPPISQNMNSQQGYSNPSQPYQSSQYSAGNRMAGPPQGGWNNQSNSNQGNFPNQHNRNMNDYPNKKPSRLVTSGFFGGSSGPGSSFNPSSSNVNGRNSGRSSGENSNHGYSRDNLNHGNGNRNQTGFVSARRMNDNNNDRNFNNNNNNNNMNGYRNNSHSNHNNNSNHGNYQGNNNDNNNNNNYYSRSMSQGGHSNPGMNNHQGYNRNYNNNNNNSNNNYIEPPPPQRDFSSYMTQPSTEHLKRRQKQKLIDPEATQTFSPVFSRRQDQMKKNVSMNKTPVKKEKSPIPQESPINVSSSSSSSSSSSENDDDEKPVAKQKKKKKKKIEEEEEEEDDVSQRLQQFEFTPFGGKKKRKRKKKRRKSSSIRGRIGNSVSSSSGSSSSDDDDDDDDIASFFKEEKKKKKNDKFITPPPPNKKAVIVVDEDEDDDDDDDSSLSSFFNDNSGEEEKSRKKKKKKKKKKQKRNSLQFVQTPSSTTKKKKKKKKYNEISGEIVSPPPPLPHPPSRRRNSNQQQSYMDMYHQPSRMTVLICRKCKKHLDDEDNSKFIKKKTITVSEDTKIFIFKFLEVLIPPSSRRNSLSMNSSLGDDKTKKAYRVVEVEKNSKQFLTNITCYFNRYEDLDSEVLSIKEEGNHMNILLSNQLNWTEPLFIPRQQQQQQQKYIEFNSRVEGMVYRLLLCKSCKYPVGFEVVMANELNVNSLGTIYLIKNEDIRKRKMSSPSFGGNYSVSRRTSSNDREYGNKRKRRKIVVERN